MYVRNVVFGVEDSLVSTVGLLSGIAAAGVPRGTVFLTGTVLIFVEAFSMAVGSFLSERSVEEYERASVASGRNSLIAGSVMFFSYFLSGFVPLLPYFFTEVRAAFWSSIFLSLIALFLLGLVSGRMFKADGWKSALRTFFVGGIAVAVGVLVGQFLKVG